jgi:hypothetical protein
VDDHHNIMLDRRYSKLEVESEDKDPSLQSISGLLIGNINEQIINDNENTHDLGLLSSSDGTLAP